MCQWPVEFVVEILAPYTLASFSCARGIAALNHKVGNVSVEGDAPVVARLREPDKVPYRLGCRLGLQLDGEVAQVGLYPGVALCLDALGLEHEFLVGQERPLAARFRGEARAGEAGCGLAGGVCRGVGCNLLVLYGGLPRDGGSSCDFRLFQRSGALVDVAACFSRLARLFDGGFCLEHLVAHAAQRAGVDVACLALVLLLPRQLRLLAVLQVLELVEIAARHVLRVLQGDDVGARKGLVIEQVLPHLGLYVHALDRVPREDVCVAAVADGDDVRVVGEDLVGDGVDEVAFTVAEAGAERVCLCIAREDEADEVLFL